MKSYSLHQNSLALFLCLHLKLSFLSVDSVLLSKMYILNWSPETAMIDFKVEKNEQIHTLSLICDRLQSNKKKKSIYGLLR